MIENLVIYDIETICNCFIVCFLDVKTLKKKSFILHKEKFELEELIAFLRSLINHNYKMIGFNNVWFDSQVLDYIWHNYKDGYKVENDVNHSDLKQFARELCIENIYKESQRVINVDDYQKYSELKPEWKLFIPQIDLYLINHYTNANRRTSLKWLEFTMGLNNIEEMPYSHKDNLTYEQALQCLDYCWNDIEATYQFYLYCIGEVNNLIYKGVNKLQFRLDIQEEFGIPCINFDDVKIGDNINKLIYSQLIGTTPKHLPKRGTKRDAINTIDCIDTNIKFEDKSLKQFYDEFIKVQFDPLNIKKDQFTKFRYKDLIISFGFGGLHTEDKPRIIENTDEYYLSDKDCTGMYPRTIIERQLFPEHLGIEWCKGCEKIYNQRKDIYKPASKKDPRAKSFSEAFKLANNGGSFGKTNEVNSWQYDPKVTFSITLYNQIALLKLTEMLYSQGIKVISQNTDGILSYVKYSQKDLYESICKEWEKLTHHDLEETLYTKFIQTSVNDYIAIKTDGEIKKKGDFESNKELHKNSSLRIIPLALEAYFIQNINYKNFITNHTEIKDFCIGCKVKSDFTLINHKILNGEYIQEKGQKVTRYYISNNGGNLVKHYHKTPNRPEKLISVQSGWKSEILNNINPLKNIKDYNINYNYYIKAVERIIFAIKPPKIQGKLFDNE